MRVLACPGCGVKIKIPEGRVGRCNCPKCGKALLIKAPGGGTNAAASTGSPPSPAAPFPETQPDPLQPLAAPSLPASFPVQSTYGALPGQGVSPRQNRAKRAATGGGDHPVKDFLKPLGIGLGILCGLLLLLGTLGFVSETIALVACFLGAGAALAMIFGGQIWVYVMAFQESVVQGLLTLFVPYYWIVFVATRKGRALRPLLLIISSIAPLLISLAMLAVFLPKYQGHGLRLPGSRSSGIPPAKLADFKARIQQTYDKSAETDVLRTVSFPSMSQVGPVNWDRAEEVLAELPGYERGSFRYDARGRKVMFQYRGPKEVAAQFGLYLAAKGKVFMTFTPTFTSNPLPSKDELIAVNQSPARPSFTFTPAPAIADDKALPEAADNLHTVSFQTLSQTHIDQAAAEQALAQAQGYVAGSFRFDAQQQLITLQYRGTKTAATQIGLSLQSRLQIMMRLSPTFVEGPGAVD